MNKAIWVFLYISWESGKKEIYLMQEEVYDQFIEYQEDGEVLRTYFAHFFEWEFLV